MVNPLVKIGQFLNLREVGYSGQVSKSWHLAMQHSSIWQNQFENKKIPAVDGQNRDYKKDFKILYPITLSGRDISCLGEFVGEVPKISEEDFNRLFENDPYESNKKIYQTFLIIVEPRFFKRKYSYCLEEKLLKNGDFQMNGKDKVDLLVPYSLKNIKILSSSKFTLKKNVKGPVLRGYKEVFQQCSFKATKVNISFMRSEVPKQSRMLWFHEQQELFQKHRFEMPRLSVRSLFNVVKILNTGKCPDSNQPEFTTTSTSDTARIEFGDYPLTIGGYSQDEGIHIVRQIGYGYGSGSVPCWTAKEIKVY